MPRKKATSRKKSTHGSVKLREKRLRNGDTSFYLDIYTGKGNRTYEFLKLFTVPGNEEHNREVRLRAMDLRNEREREVISGTYGSTPAHAKKQPFLPFFETVATERGGTYPPSLTKFKAFLEGKEPTFAAITPALCEGFQEYLSGKVSSNSAATYYKRFVATLNLAVRRGMLASNPTERAESLIRSEDVNRNHLTIEQLRTLAEKPCGHDQVRRAFLFACFTGLRYSDIIRLEWSDIKKDSIRLKIKKTERWLTVPLHDTAKELLGQRQQEGKVFRIPSLSHTNTHLYVWGLKAGIEWRLSFHASRHTFACLSIANGVDLYTLKDLLGHRSVKTTEIYARVVDGQREQAVAKLPTL